MAIYVDFYFYKKYSGYGTGPGTGSVSYQYVD
jgi:hypothetical protein